ncbi:MAG: hypothetical protein ACE37J_13935 [Pikeienuella sp.]|uniref:hypothetical protein n=1 Tax=Pikeienuella sp. TaxID=2831957 RepID=UPI00391B2566
MTAELQQISRSNCQSGTGQNITESQNKISSSDAPGGPADAAAEVGLAEKQEGTDGWAREIVEPLTSSATRKGLKPPRGWAEAPWAARLAEIGRPHRGRSVAELEAIRAAIRLEGKAKGGRWPAPQALELLVKAVLAKRKAETGGDSLVDQREVGRALGWWAREGTAPPARLFDLRRRCRMAAVISGGVPAEALAKAGHRVPDDLAGIGAEARP